MKKTIAVLRGSAVEPRRQRGAVLFISLMFLIILTVIGLSAANVGILQERMANNVRESNEAFQRAEAALAVIELELGRIVRGSSGGEDLVINVWEEARSDLTVGRHSCTLTRIEGGESVLSIEEDDVWEPITLEGFQAEYFIVSLTDSIVSGTIFGSACRPMNQLSDTAIDEYFLVTTKARAQGAEGRNPAEAIVQSIYYYPNPI